MQDVLDSARAEGMPPEARAVLEIELLTGCSVCERRLLEAGDHLLRDVQIVSVTEQPSGRTVAYPVCGEHVPAVFRCSGDSEGSNGDDFLELD